MIFQGQNTISIKTRNLGKREARFVKDRAIIERMAEGYAQKYWFAWLGFFKPRPGWVASGKTLAVQVSPLRSVREN